MPVDYPVEQMMSDIMAVVKDNMEYIVPCAILVGVLGFVIRWFMISVDLGDWAFGRKGK